MKNDTGNEKRPRGRPRKHRDDAARLYDFRHRHRRFELALDAEAAWRLTQLAKAWACSRSDVVRRLILEASERYQDILLPETEETPPGPVSESLPETKRHPPVAAEPPPPSPPAAATKPTQRKLTKLDPDTLPIPPSQRAGVTTAYQVLEDGERIGLVWKGTTGWYAKHAKQSSMLDALSNPRLYRTRARAVAAL